MTTTTESPGDISIHDLVCLILLGWAEPVGRTQDGKVTSYALTPAGRAILKNQTERERHDPH